MKVKFCTFGLLLIGTILLFASLTEAKVSADKAARLGKELTPLGGIRAGNDEGTIPAWDGGIITPPSCYKPRTFHCDPFPDDRRLFTIPA